MTKQVQHQRLTVVHIVKAKMTVKVVHQKVYHGYDHEYLY